MMTKSSKYTQWNSKELKFCSYLFEKLHRLSPGILLYDSGVAVAAATAMATEIGLLILLTVPSAALP